MKKKQTTSVRAIYGSYLEDNLKNWAKEKNFPSNIIDNKKTRELLFNLIIKYDPDILKTFKLKKEDKTN